MAFPIIPALVAAVAASGGGWLGSFLQDKFGDDPKVIYNNPTGTFTARPYESPKAKGSIDTTTLILVGAGLWVAHKKRWI